MKVATKPNYKLRILRALRNGPLHANDFKPVNPRVKAQAEFGNALALTGRDGLTAYNRFTRQHSLTPKGLQHLNEVES